MSTPSASPGRPVRVAFGTVPKDGGTFTFYRNIRPALAQMGVDLRAVSVGRDNAHLWDDAYADAGCVLLAPHSVSLKEQARSFVGWCVAEEIDIALGINSPAILSALMHLPHDMHAMARCANGFDHGYRITMSGRDRLASIVALSPKLRDDLIAEYGARPDLITLIPNGIDPAPFKDAAAQPRGQADVLRIAFLGRLEHTQKGVLHLPLVADALHASGAPFHMTIAGKGVHADTLRDRMATHIAAGRVSLPGALDPAQIPDFLARHDAFVFTSHFEGMPNALIEAMMAGCVPASFVIKGTTDFMIRQGETGLLVDQGDTDGLAKALADLAKNRTRLADMSNAVARDARDRFSNLRAAQAYASLFKDVAARPPMPVSVRPWSAFEPDPNFPQTWRRFVPPALKDQARKLRALASARRNRGGQSK